MSDSDNATIVGPVGDVPYGAGKTRVPIGTKRALYISYQDMLAADPGEPPLAVTYPGDHKPMPRRITYDRYYDPEFARLEDEHIWQKCWLVAGREEDIPNVGDRMTFDIRGKSYLIVRSGPDEIRAFYNSCRHRGRLLCEGTGSGAHIRCPFHAWTFNLDGSVAWIPAEDDFPTRTHRGFALIPVRVGTWNGNIFICADEATAPLEKALGVMPAMFRDFDTTRRYTVIHLRKKVRANWKVVHEAFQEGYHVLETHPDALPSLHDTAGVYDCWEDEYSHIGRLINPTGTPSGFISDITPLRQAIEANLLYYGTVAEPGRGETPLDARAYLAEAKRTRLAAERGAPLEHCSTSHMLDFVKFSMFPNFSAAWGELSPVTYRATPLGMNPEEALFEARLLMPCPRDGPRPPSAKPVDVDFDEPCSDYPELGILGQVIDEDMSNMPQVQRGMRAARGDKAMPILALEQEKLIAHFHERYDALLGLDARR